MEFIIPKSNEVFYLTTDFNDSKNHIVLKVIHTKSRTKVFWYLDRKFTGITENIHEMEVLPKIGKHIITAMDELGNEISREIEILK